MTEQSLEPAQIPPTETITFPTISQASIDAFSIVMEAGRLNKKLIKLLYSPAFDWAEETIIRAVLVDLNRAQTQIDNLAGLWPIKAHGQ